MYLMRQALPPQNFRIFGITPAQTLDISHKLLRPISYSNQRRSSELLLSRLLRPFLVNTQRLFVSRSSTGIGRGRKSSKSQDEEFDNEVTNQGPIPGFKNYSNEVVGMLAPDSSKRRSAILNASQRSSEDDSQADVESALKKKRKSISRLLKKYKRRPEIQQQLKIAFADGYAYAEQDHEQSGNKNLGDKVQSIASRFGDVVWIGVFCWIGYHFYSELKGSFSGGFSRSLFNTLGPYEVNAEDIAVTFDDVKGVEEAKDELQDIVEYLKDPEKFSVLGGKMPHGVLLVGEPGVGKTLLAKAVAGESGVPFFHAAGSEFDEIFVGTGAKRVRQLFNSAKERAPAVIFIDEIDSVGGKRTSSPGHPYANQTINMLLSEMDGFSKNEGVIVIGATNKRDNLDKALIRPGRFDVEVKVYPPDVKARKELLDFYCGRIVCDLEVDTLKLARDTRGFVGADIDNMVNQAAIKAGRENASAVSMDHLNWARDKISMGPEKKSKIPDEKVNWNTAVHEAGHALVAYFTPHALPIRKVTIMPRGQALGYVEQTPKDVMINQTKAELLASMDVAAGGKIGEEMEHASEDVTPGCWSDLSKATEIARSMVLIYGMSDAVGVRAITTEEDYQSLSNKTKTLIDAEIKALVDASYKRAEALLKKHRKEHLRLAKSLIKYETLDGEDVENIMKNKALKIEEELTVPIEHPHIA